VVPEIASRRHIELVDGIYRGALEEAGISDSDIDAICVTSGPGLIGSILVGLSFAKGLSFSLNKPLIAVNHVQAHAMSIFIEEDVDFPFIALVVSGGHTVILKVEDQNPLTVLGSTRDDAAGEAFDKIAKYLNIGYPGGRVIEEISKNGFKDYVAFPRPMLDENNYDFSFSGLKTSFINYVKRNGVNDGNIMHVLSSFQEAIFDVLLKKVLRATKDFKIGRVVVGGGVASNRRMREVFCEAGKREGLEVYFPSSGLCMDNGVMVALMGYYNFMKSAFSPLDVQGFSRMKLN